MTACERSSLTKALLIVVPMYAALFGALSLLHFDGRTRSNNATADAADTLLVRLSSGTTEGGRDRVAESATPARTAHASPPGENAAKAPKKPTPTADRPASHRADGPARHTVGEGTDVPAVPRNAAATSASATARSGLGSTAAATAAERRTIRDRSVRNAVSREAGPGGAATAAASTATARAVAKPAPGKQNDGIDSIAAVLAVLRERILSERSYPPAAKRRGIQGSLTIAATVGVDGQLLGTRLVRSSGSEILDRAGMTLLRKVFPIENPTSHAFTIDVPVTYRLKSSG